MARLRLAMLLIGVGTAVWVAPLAGARATYGAQTTADEPQYLMSALSLGEDLDLDVSDERADGRYREFHEVALPLQEAARPDGRLVSPHDPLLPVLLAGPVRLGGWVAAKLTLAALAGALAAALLWTAVRRFGVPLIVAVIVVAAYSLAAPFAVYGTQVYPELPAALAVTVAIGALMGSLGPRGLAVLAAAVCTLPWLSVKYAPIAAVLIVLGTARLVRRGDRQSVIVLLGVLTLAAAGFGWVHLEVYGGLSPYASGSHFAGSEASVVGTAPDYLGRSWRLVGLLVDRGFGLVAWHPAWLLAVPALAALTRRRPPGWDVLVAPLAAGWLTATFVALTMHGWWWPGRQLVVVLPAAVLAVAWWAAQWAPARSLVAVGGVLGALTYAWVAAESLARRVTLVVDFETTTAPVHRVLRVVLPDGRLNPPGTDLRLTLVTGALAVLALLGWRTVGSGRAAARRRVAGPRPLVARS